MFYIMRNAGFISSTVLGLITVVLVVIRTMTMEILAMMRMVVEMLVVAVRISSHNDGNKKSVNQ